MAWKRGQQARDRGSVATIARDRRRGYAAPVRARLFLVLVAALLELTSLPRRIGDHQAAAMQRDDELLQLFDSDLLRRKFGLEAILDAQKSAGSDYCTLICNHSRNCS